MKVDGGRFTVEIPDGLEDVTAYVFDERPHDPDSELPPERLSVAFEPLPAGTPPSEMIAYFKRSMERAGPGGAAFREGAVTVRNAPAATLVVDLPGAKARLFLAVLAWPGGLAAKVQFESGRKDAEVAFELMVASIRPIGVRATPPPGFVRRRAGRAWLLMPLGLGPLSSYAFTENAGKCRLFIETEPALPAGEPPDFEGLVEHGVFESIEVEALNEGACPADGRPIEERSWCVDRIGEEADHLGTTWLRDAWITFEGGAAARLWLIENGSPACGDALWPEIVAGIVMKGASR